MGHVTMSVKELDRVQLMTRLSERRLTQRHAAELAGVTERQVRRWYRRFKRDGAAGLVSRQCGQASHRQFPAESRARALDLVRARYADFGPTLAHQTLTEEHGLALCVETLRQWMIAAEIWLPRAQRLRRTRKPSAARTARLSRRARANRRLCARLVRGPRADLHASGVRR